MKFQRAAVAIGALSRSIVVHAYDYGEVLAKSILFCKPALPQTMNAFNSTAGDAITPTAFHIRPYPPLDEAQRSGSLPSTQRVNWRSDSAQNDGSDNDVDLEGGWYDAGDFVKFGFPLASSATLIAWGLVEFDSGYKKVGQFEYGLDCLKWVVDYLVKCHTVRRILAGCHYAHADARCLRKHTVSPSC